VKLFTGLFLVFLAAYVMGVFSFDMDRRLIDDVVLVREGDSRFLQLEFSAPVRLIGSYPEAMGDIAQVKLSVIALDRFDENVSLLNKFVGSEEGKEIHMTHMRYEGNVPGGPFLVMKFSKHVHWKIIEGEGLLGMQIEIKES
jgi:hypothetical protein